MSQDELYTHIETLLKGAGFSVVEFSMSRHKGSFQIKIVLYHPSGIGVDQLAKAHRLVNARLEILLSGQDLYVEVMSPGVDRILKSPREYAIFIKRGARFYVREKTDWVSGIIEESTTESVTVRTKAGMETIPVDSIIKARLDYSQEVS